MKVVDLCCGAGGATEGLAAAGIDVTLAVDNWPLAVKSHEANHPDAEHVVGDVRDLVGSIGQVDIVIGSPPCPEFSHLGGKAVDPDTSIIQACTEIVQEARPKWFWLENVPMAGPYFEQHGHMVQYVRASDHGLYHERRRAFAGLRLPVAPTKPCPVVFQTILASEVKAGARPHHRKTGDGNRLRDFLARIPDVRDYLWAMGVRQDYHLEGNKSDQVRQVGNMICPPVATAVAKAQERPVMATLMQANLGRSEP